MPLLTALIWFVVYVMVVGLVCGLLLYLNDAIPIPEPFHRIVRIAVLVVGVLVVILLLLGLLNGAPPLHMRL
jgi:hypothetical protein